MTTVKFQAQNKSSYDGLINYLTFNSIMVEFTANPAMRTITITDMSDDDDEMKKIQKTIRDRYYVFDVLEDKEADTKIKLIHNLESRLNESQNEIKVLKGEATQYKELYFHACKHIRVLNERFNAIKTLIAAITSDIPNLPKSNQ